ncbi:TPA: hypothetical protein N0F65_005932 [Lagenidium giganteum]|uniref:Uncharacterized protein n=1 Tax=Lagenidium giganteum TaxID=4803 RepID=A0AAV2ZAJ0_9STRA|nr:TPA: hypothetical protein N0F65_005932 [Lagenidium giganteum]
MITRDFLAALVDVDLLRRDNYDALVLMTDLLQERVADNDLSDDSKRHVRRLVHTIVTSAETTRDQLVLLRQRLLDSLRREEDAMWLSHDPENNSDNATSCAWAFQADHTRFIHGDERTWSALQELSVENGLSSVLTFLLPPSFQLLVRGDNQDSSELMTLGTAQLSSAHDNEDALLCLVLECVPTAWSIETTRLVHNFVHAQRELSLSLYFLRFVGAADDGTKTQYAFELPSVQRLSDALCLDTKGRLSPTSASFRSHARELLLALLDLHEQSTHQLLTRLSLDNVVVSVSGRRLLLTQLEFGNAIDPFEAYVTSAIA